MKALLVGLLALTITAPASAQPLPAPKPSAAITTPPPPDLGFPIPRTKPRVLPPGPEPLRSPEASGERVAAPRAPTARPRAKVSAAQPAASKAGGCEARIKAMGVRFSVAPAIREGQCGAERPLSVTAIQNVTFSTTAVVQCAVAEATAVWLADVVQPAARKTLKQDVTTLQVAASYACRRRNNQATGRMSEHSLANAIDVGGFTLSNGETFVIAPASSRRGAPVRFQKAIREGACGIFGTVLGPGADAFHDNHLHFDMRARRNAFCR